MRTSPTLLMVVFYEEPGLQVFFFSAISSLLNSCTCLSCAISTLFSSTHWSFPIAQHTPIEQHNMMGAPVLRPMIQALPPCHLHTYARARIPLRTTAYIPTEEGHKEHLIIGNLQH